MYRRPLPDWKSEYLDPELETMSREQIESLQVERLKETVKRCMNNPVYKERLEKAGVTPENITDVKDIRRIPFTTKQDLRDTYPFGLASVPLTECVRLHSSSGTTGNPTVILHTQKDLDEWANQVARNLWMVGLRPDDVFQNSSGYGMFTGGLGFQYGAERLGMLTIPAAAGNSLRQIKFMTDFGTTAVHAVPSYVTRLYEVMQQQGIDPRKDTKLKVLAIGAEPHSEEQRKRIENMMGVKAYNSFGMSEMCGPGVGFECKQQNGLHFWEDYYIVEIVDPNTLEPVPDGEIGELVLTSINREAMPLLRYRTRDLTRVLGRSCPCGRNHIRLDRMKGRSDDMMVLRGVNIFPIQIEKILMQYKELANNYLITLTTDENNDNMTVEVELEELFTDDYQRLTALQKSITRALKDEILLTPIVKLVPKGTLPVSDGKAVRVVDKRTVYQ
ncbi:MAG: phenylacetate--CoA ligase [Prevotellaceae bacterium]|nr:phenylacetate--CoA ligase [Prevotellaceae bacterium]